MSRCDVMNCVIGVNQNQKMNPTSYKISQTATRHQDAPQGRASHKSKHPTGAKRLPPGAPRLLPKLVESRIEDGCQLVSFLAEFQSAGRIEKVAANEQLKPEVRFVRLFENNLQFSNVFSLRAGTTSRSVVCSHGRCRFRQLIAHHSGFLRLRKFINQLQNSERKTHRPFF
jgi:hypothetical protein